MKSNVQKFNKLQIVDIIFNIIFAIISVIFFFILITSNILPSKYLIAIILIILIVLVINFLISLKKERKNVFYVIPIIIF